ncbi:MAG: DUF6295 family protein [Acidimicrobiales bacterium]
MCTYSTERARIEGSGKGAEGWFDVTEVLAYFDHPYHSHSEHTLNLDFVNSSHGPAARVAVELTAESARELVRCIEAALQAAGPLAATAGG